MNCPGIVLRENRRVKVAEHVARVQPCAVRGSTVAAAVRATAPVVAEGAPEVIITDARVPLNCPRPVSLFRGSPIWILTIAAAMGPFRPSRKNLPCPIVHRHTSARPRVADAIRPCKPLHAPRIALRKHTTHKSHIIIFIIRVEVLFIHVMSIKIKNHSKHFTTMVSRVVSVRPIIIDGPDLSYREFFF